MPVAMPPHAASGGACAPYHPPPACPKRTGFEFSRRHHRQRLGCTVLPYAGSDAWSFVPIEARVTAPLRLRLRQPPTSCRIFPPSNELTSLPPKKVCIRSSTVRSRTLRRRPPTSLHPHRRAFPQRDST